MSQTASGILILSLIVLVMGGVGLYAGWDDLKQDFKRMLGDDSHNNGC